MQIFVIHTSMSSLALAWGGWSAVPETSMRMEAAWRLRGHLLPLNVSWVDSDLEWVMRAPRQKALSPVRSVVADTKTSRSCRVHSYLLLQ